MRAQRIRLKGLAPKGLLELSDKMLLSLDLAEMAAIKDYYAKLKREPTDVELETLAQTWSEHCKHKTFHAEIEFNENGETKTVDSLFKTCIRGATEEISKKAGWLVSVFKDNAGIIRFNDSLDAAFKVETHNHPSALDPYGGANTGIGGVIRDVLGCGLGAKPVASTDIFCFGPHDLPFKELPKGILHPKRIAKGVREGVRDYGNRMGIPTVNGAMLFDERFIGNPLVFCGTVGVIPRGMHEKEAKPGDHIVVAGGRTGRDGIHGATFSSIELDETTSSSAVQIGNAIEEKKFLDVLLAARDKGLYRSVTDCGAGGFSSAVGEMGEKIGAKVRLERAPLKYKGLAPWEIWVSESQERMVFAVPPENSGRLLKMFEDEDVEAFVLGEFTGSGKLVIWHEKDLVAELEMGFLHNGLPRKKMRAEWDDKKEVKPSLEEGGELGVALKKILAMPNIASKETTIRQYDHEVQGGSVLKPLVGAENDGPGDASIVRPDLSAKEGIAISNGINTMYGDVDTYWMAASCIDEAIRNIIAVGGSLRQIALLDNFCWGNPNDPKKLGELVRTARACHDFAVAYGTPFISGKDSFHNEYRVGGKAIAIPPTLLISAMGVMPDVEKRVSMDFKAEGNLIYVLGETFAELGGSHYLALMGDSASSVPKVSPAKAKRLFNALSKAIAVGKKNSERIVRACHDCSEGGLGVALAEMAFAGMIGASVDLRNVPLGEKITRNDFILFSESNSRFVVEVNKKFGKKFEALMKGNAFAKIGETAKGGKLRIKGANGRIVVDAGIRELKEAWKGTLNW